MRTRSSRRTASAGIASGKRIFVVETDQVVRSALKFILHAENETHALSSVEQAYVAAQSGKPDLVLLGLPIVRNRGLRVLSEIAARLPDAKILVLADTPSDPLAQACLASGAHDVLGKPIANHPARSKVDILLGEQGNRWSLPGNVA